MLKNSKPSLLLIDKPKGMSSFSIIRELRRRTGVRKFGHAGTLDPLATGLMLIGVEEGTKLLTDLVGLNKEYLAVIMLGEQRATGDMEGEILAEKAYQNDLSIEQIKSALEKIIGETELPVSAYSAIKKAGVPMYKRARAAAQKREVVTEVPSRKMKVYEAELLNIEEKVIEGKKRLLLNVRFAVGSGTYVRSLGEEVGRMLDYPAVLADLRRTKVGPYAIEAATKLEDVNTNNLRSLCL